MKKNDSAHYEEIANVPIDMLLFETYVMVTEFLNDEALMSKLEKHTHDLDRGGKVPISTEYTEKETDRLQKFLAIIYMLNIKNVIREGHATPQELSKLIEDFEGMLTTCKDADNIFKTCQPK